MLFLVSFSGLTHIAPLNAQSAEEITIISAALSQMRAGEWDEAAKTAGPPGSVPRDIIEWHRLRASHGTFPDTLAFLNRHGDWPGLKLLRKRSELSIPPDANPEDVRDFFAIQPPQTGHGALMLAQAMTAQGEVEQAKAQAVLAWFSLPMSTSEEVMMLDAFADALTPYHWARLDMLLWRGHSTGAKRMLGRVDSAHQALAQARIGLRDKVDGVNALISAIPQTLQDDPGLAYERFLWRATKGRNQDAIDLILERSTGADGLGEPARWGSWRRTLARWSMRDGQARQAYRLAANHHIAEGSNRNDLEWIAGYVALRKLDDPTTALKHFQAFRDGVDTPISLGRAGYWLGRTYEALGQAEKAQASYLFGARHQTSFYGQLSAEKAGVAMDLKLTGAEQFDGWKSAAFWDDSNMVAGRLLLAAGERYLALRFAQHLSESLSRGEVGQMTAWAESVNAPYLQVKLAKYVLKRGLLFERPYFALTTLGTGRNGVPPEFSLAIARRESEFNPTVKSGVGALGMMQLMPATARDMAQELEVGYSAAKLISDPEYNIRLGTEYLAYLFSEFGQNPVLIAVAYNAGPGRARSWSARMGHPGASSVDVIDWIEHIPFRETRNYVMRVIESLAVYRARRSGQTTPIRLMEELKQY
ncbi:MAG: lytic transglycosylase domain-containing protein [Rhodobacteraceae bacterium]|nr:lytic transglycosylase domain-containing protein [Paracoccaceae bacterium]